MILNFGRSYGCRGMALKLMSLIWTLSIVATAQTGTILCPGLPARHYCDCSGDCTTVGGTFCECEEAQECCAAMIYMGMTTNDDLYGNDDYGNDDDI